MSKSVAFSKIINITFNEDTSSNQFYVSRWTICIIHWVGAVHDRDIRFPVKEYLEKRCMFMKRPGFKNNLNVHKAIRKQFAKQRLSKH